jgi:hypothetical protein
VNLPRVCAALALACVASAAAAGPPYLTDDPVPTDTGHWEFYVFGSGEGGHSALDADAGIDINYGGAKDLQLTATVPLSFTHEPDDGWHSGTGDLELAAKYRFFHDERSGFSAAVFPRAILPTSSLEHGEKARFLLPLWIGKDFAGGTSLFGGGGYVFNPGDGNRDFWQAGLAVTQDLNDTVSLGAEITHQGPDTDVGTTQTRAGIGSIVKLSDHYALLFSGGPTWADHQTAYHFYAALGMNF